MAAAGPALGSIVCGPHYQSSGQAWILSGLLVERLASESLVSRAGARTMSLGPRTAGLLLSVWAGVVFVRSLGRPVFCHWVDPEKGRNAQDCS